uniref:Sushi domain-containing protein n=1 Tax=Electrophorus electricus TaxID=8005 RepID=A0AAY5EBA8_ELEEL
TCNVAAVSVLFIPKQINLVLVFAFPLTVPKPCVRPELEDGFLVPKKDIYENGALVFYACDKGMKPAIQSWVRVLKCDNSKWSHTPACIPQSACIATEVPHAKPRYQLDGWYSNTMKVYYQCDRGYEFRATDRATCTDGKWTLPESYVCDPPPRVDNALILEPYQDVFEHNQRVTYACKNGYKMVGHEPILDEPFPLSDINEICSAENEYQFRLCGTYPAIENGDVFEVQDGRALTVQCAMLYKLDGPKSIMCVNEEWTTLPVCKGQLRRMTLFYYQQAEYISHGDQMNGHCTNYWNYMYVICNNGRALYRGCKFNIPMQLGQECILSLFKISHLSTVSINFLLTIT